MTGGRAPMGRAGRAAAAVAALAPALTFTLALALIVAAPGRPAAGPAPAAAAGEAALARELAAALKTVVAARAGDAPLGLMLVRPAPEATPVPPEKAAALARRVALRAVAAAEAGARIRVLADDASLAGTLESVRRRQGRDGWRAALSRMRGGQADLALVSALRPVPDGLSVRLHLLDLASGAVLAETAAARLPRPRLRAADAGAAVAAAAARLADAVPEARQIGVRPFTEAATGVPSPAGRYLAGLVQEAWLAAAGATVGGGPAAAELLLGSAPAEPRFVLGGTLWPVSAGRADLRVLLFDRGTARAAHRLAIDPASLPPRLARTLDPEAPPPTAGFAPLLGRRAATPGNRPARLELEVDGGAAPVYRVCRDPAPATLRGCDRLRLRLRADRDGAVLCLALGDDGAFGVLAPAAHYPAPELRAGRWLALPDALPRGPGGGKVVWFARGAPGVTLVACYLFPRPGAVPRDALAAFSGRSLAPDAVLAVADRLVAAAPLAEAHAVVTVVAPGARLP